MGKEGINEVEQKGARGAVHHGNEQCNEDRDREKKQ
jgi:hypothetical protein